MSAETPEKQLKAETADPIESEISLGVLPTRLTHEGSEPSPQPSEEVLPESLSISGIVRCLTPVDLFLLFFSSFYIGFAVIGSAWIPRWGFVAGWCSAVILIVIAVALLASQNDSKGVRIFHMFYIVPLVPAFFKLTEKMSYVLHGKDFDDVLIMGDHLLFRADPTTWLYAHFPHPPILTEYLQICYSLFYFLPIVLAIELYRRGAADRQDHAFGEIPLDALERVRFIMVYGFCLSYVGYLILPAIGPRFTLHDFLNLDRELPGVWLTSFLRWILNAGENMRQGMSIYDIERVVTRDAFPSGHTDMTFVTIMLAFQFKARTRWMILILGSSLIFGTVYLRYHYVVDLLGGLLFGLITLYSWRTVERLLLRAKSSLLSRLAT